MSAPTVGMIGAGQLAQMSLAPAIALGINLKILASDESDSAAKTAKVEIGNYRDLEVLRNFAKGCDFLTFEHELVPNGHLRILEEEGFVINEIMDYTSAEEDNVFLEGTGSLLLDRENGKAYCALSPRADEELMIEFCEDFEFTPVIFEAFQTVNGERKQIYHTNVMLTLGDTFAVICADCIDDKKERKMVLDSLRGDDKEVVLITEEQVNNFAGNMLEVKGKDDKRYLVMSESAYKSLTKKQLAQLEAHVEIIHSSLDTIEACGGGSARCMMAEIFLPKN